MSQTVKTLKTKLEKISTWCVSSQIGAVPAALRQLQTAQEKLTTNTDKRFRELTAELASAQAARGVSHGGFSDFQDSALQTPDRNVFDPRDYKLAPLDAKPSLAKWKKWRRDLEAFIDTIGVSWKGTSGLLRELRHREGLFDSSQLQEAVTAAEARGDKAPKIIGFDYEDKKDVLYQAGRGAQQRGGADRRARRIQDVPATRP